jgi:hypothetical protein
MLGQAGRASQATVPIKKACQRVNAGGIQCNVRYLLSLIAELSHLIGIARPWK